MTLAARWTGGRTVLVKSLSPTVGAALVGNAFIGSDRADKPSVVALSPYTAWVIGYDIPWTYQLWRHNL